MVGVLIWPGQVRGPNTYKLLRSVNHAGPGSYSRKVLARDRRRLLGDREPLRKRRKRKSRDWLRGGPTVAKDPSIALPWPEPPPFCSSALWGPTYHPG